ncbi:hypothetical protein ACLBXM_08310 [Xanthobacteraceae bacterium A53D]
MMAFDVEVAVILLLGFLAGGAVAFVLRRRAEQRRRLEMLARATVSGLGMEVPSARHATSPQPSPVPAREPARPMLTGEHVPLAPDDPELPLGLPEADAAVRRKPARDTRLRADPPVEAASSSAPLAAPVAPPLLAAPEGAPDDLQRIKGIGPQNAQKLNGLGIFHLRQIAAWTPEEVRWVGAALAFPGRIEREAWVTQAQALREQDAPDKGDPSAPA